MNTDPKPQLHVSYLEDAARCGIKFQRRWGYRFGVWHEEEVIPAGPAAHLGTAAHKSAQTNLQHKLDTGEPIPAEEAMDIGRDAFSAAWESGVLLGDEEAKRPKEVRGSHMDVAASLSLLHHVDVAPGVEPLAVEDRWVLVMPDSPIDLAGQIDARTATAIHDIKTKHQKQQPHAVQSLQMAMYSLAHKKLYGSLPQECRLDVLIKTKTPKAQIIVAKPTDQWIQPLYHRIENLLALIAAVKAGHQAFTPCDPEHAWQCTKRYCGYATTCKYWSGR